MTCRHCSTEFVAQRSTALFCSDACRKAHNRAVLKDETAPDSEDEPAIPAAPVAPKLAEVIPDAGPRQWPLDMSEADAEARLHRMVDYARFTVQAKIPHMTPDQPFVLARLIESGLERLAKKWPPKFAARKPGVWQPLPSVQHSSAV